MVSRLTIIPIKKDGKYYYVDFSHGFFCDTVTNSITVLSQVDQKAEEPLVTVQMVLQERWVDL